MPETTSFNRAQALIKTAAPSCCAKRPYNRVSWAVNPTPCARALTAWLTARAAMAVAVVAAAVVSVAASPAAAGVVVAEVAAEAAEVVGAAASAEAEDRHGFNE
jgi:hypothetical protein